MIGIWVHRDGAGIVQGASVAEYTDAALLRQWRRFGFKVELIAADFVTVEAPLPAGATVIQTLGSVAPIKAQGA